MKKMQKLLLLLPFLAAVVASCGRKESGQLIGALDRPHWKGLNPYGMVYVPSGTLHIGTGDEDLSKA
ncbi:MAG: gliding motility-associated lipoprotein, partial [Saprospiraceae bacterium]